ncbi:MAG: glucosaminidase domain-containing protein [Chloroflexi bacterium]|nr:glucosaminidase domain-containing protein [Chloroflexota bacterium]
MGKGHLLSTSRGKVWEALGRAARAIRGLKAETNGFGYRTLEKASQLRTAHPLCAIISAALLVGISATASVVYFALPQQIGTPVPEFLEEVPESLQFDADPLLGQSDTGWENLWAAPPNAVAAAGLANPATPPPTVPDVAPQDARPVLAARSGEREKDTPTPSPTPRKQLTFEEQFIAAAAPAAQASERETGVPASVTIAQAMLESDWGKSGLSKTANNYFGIKATGKGGTAGVVWMNTWEVINGQNVTVNAPFRAYKSMADSFVDHGKFFVENARYALALKSAGDSIAFAREIHRAGYATDPAYSDKLIGLMKKFNLLQFDLP